MADPTRYPDTGEEPDGRSDPSIPRWVLVLGIVLAIGLVLLLVVLHITGILGPRGH